MKTTPINVLLLHSSGKNNSKLIQALDENGYQTEAINDIESAIQKITTQPVDLLICDNIVNEQNGFTIFNMLMKYLRNYGIPFFLVLESFEKEDMLIGLEIGIDNFIVYPINKDSISYKIENHLRKKGELNIFETGSFINYFNRSMVAMFYVEDDKISLANPAFYKLNNGCATDMTELSLSNVFNIAHDKQNVFNYRRFQNGITNYCQLFRVNCLKNSDLSFDISFYRGKPGTTKVFAEIIEIHDGKEINQLDDNRQTDNPTEILLPDRIKLTRREKQVFNLSANGLPIKIIADELGLSERTVEKHRANIMAKANAKNMIEAIIHIQKGSSKIEFTELNF
ncbi:hypothetical protein MASR2M47_29470 [Draconibacterium sp.]|jgi:two-component system alkaline phosphatase synthesis response regulator PhoP